MEVSTRTRRSRTLLKVKLPCRFLSVACFAVDARSGVPRIFFLGGGEGSTNSVEDRGQRERGSGGGSLLVRGSAQFANE
jgi:hypothetical protein